MEKEVVVRNTKIEANIPKRLDISIGYIMGFVGGESRVANYIAFVQDNDVADERGGERAFILFYR